MVTVMCLLNFVVSSSWHVFHALPAPSSKHALDLLSEYAMLACKPAKTPLMPKIAISNEASDKDPLLDNITNYQKLMGKLIYLTNTRPDISYVVHYLSQCMHSPLKYHLNIAFKILRYLKSCPSSGIHIVKNSDILTKGLDAVQRNELVKKLSMFDIYQRAKVTAIEELKDLTSLSLEKLIGNLKVYEVIIKKDSKMVKGKREQSRSLALKAKKESNDEDRSNSKSKDEEYAVATKKMIKVKENDLDVEIQIISSENVQSCQEKNNQRAFIGGAWSDSGEDEEEKHKHETCLVAQASNEICLGINLEPGEWIKDSGCSKLMTGNQGLFSTYQAYNRGNVIFRSNLRSNIIGEGNTHPE
nr:ribonuclease H-like domain-containing protein [Tanacetum cinerariifolium]